MLTIDTHTAEEVFNKLMESTVMKDIAGALALYDDSELFKLIDSEGNVLNYPQLIEMYEALFSNLEFVEVLESRISYEQLSPHSLLCFWTGKERIKMTGQDEAESSWCATVIIKQFNECWKIIHFHLTHF